MRNLSRRFAEVGVFLFATIASALSAQAAGFSNASLNGSYSFLTDLRTANVNTNEFAMVGVMTFDGAGHVAAPYTSNSGGTIHTGTLGGTYKVKSNGTGTINLTTGSTAKFAITLNSATHGVANGVQLLQTNDSNNEIISGTAALQSTAAESYGVSSLKGKFAFQGERWVASVNLAQNGYVGIYDFDGDGGVKGSVTFMYDGGLETNAVQGAYSVNADGSGSITLSSGVVFAFALNDVSAGRAKGFQYLRTQGNDSGNFADTGAALEQ